MNANSILKNSRIALAALCGIGLVSTFLVSPARADEWNKKTILTIDQTMQVENNVLQPGKYVMMLYNSPAERHVVQIFNGDQSRIIASVIAMPNYRLRPTGKSQFLFYETPEGAAKALRAWFYPGDNFGQEFRKPDHWMMLQTAMNIAPTPAPAEETAPPAVAENEQQQTTVMEQQETQPAPAPQVAENTPAPEPAPAPTPEPKTLPQTASPYPLIGLAGLLTLAVGALVKTRFA
jgi:hypothetical protein